MKTLGALAVLAHAFLVMGREAHIGPRGGGFDHGGGVGHGYGGRGYGGPFGDGGSGCAVSPAPPLPSHYDYQTQPEWNPLTNPQKECVSSYWETADPSPTAFCDSKGSLPSCISSACAASESEWDSYTARSASLCSEYLSCSSTGTYAYSYQTPSGDWWGAGRGRGDKRDKAWPTGDVVVTGCPWNGDGWGFPFWGGLGYGLDFWDDMGPGWKKATVTTTVTGESKSGVYTVEEAVSGDVSTLRTVGLEAVETGDSIGGGEDDSGAAAVAGQGVMAIGAALGAAMAVVGLM